MFKKTLIAAATASLIASGSLATVTTASASGPAGHGNPYGQGPAHGQTFGGLYFGGPGWSIGIGAPGFQPGHFRPRQVCEPIFKRVSWWKHGRHYSQVIKVAERCHWAQPHHRPQPHWGQSQGWGPASGPSW